MNRDFNTAFRADNSRYPASPFQLQLGPLTYADVRLILDCLEQRRLRLSAMAAERSHDPSWADYASDLTEDITRIRDLIEGATVVRASAWRTVSAWASQERANEIRASWGPAAQVRQTDEGLWAVEVPA